MTYKLVENESLWGEKKPSLDFDFWTGQDTCIDSDFEIFYISGNQTQF